MHKHSGLLFPLDEMTHLSLWNELPLYVIILCSEIYFDILHSEMGGGGRWWAYIMGSRTSRNKQGLNFHLLILSMSFWETATGYPSLKDWIWTSPLRKELSISYHHVPRWDQMPKESTIGWSRSKNFQRSRPKVNNVAILCLVEFWHGKVLKKYIFTIQ